LNGAIADISQAIQLNPNDAKVYSYRGFLKMQNGDHQGANADYERSHELTPKEAVDYMNSGVTNYIEGLCRNKILTLSNASYFSANANFFDQALITVAPAAGRETKMVASIPVLVL
jgi:Flp pilus assembly protein TadD